MSDTSEYEFWLSDSSTSDSSYYTTTSSSENIEEDITDTDNDTIISTTTNDTDVTIPLFDSFTDEDVFDIIQDIYQQIDDYYENNILKMSSPKFYTDMFLSISEVLFQEWINIDVCDEEDFQQITEFIENLHDDYLFYNTNVTSRSISNTSNAIESVNETEIENLRETIEYLQNQPQPAQRTQEWYDFRNTLLSASSLWKALGSQSQINSLIYEKCKAFNSENDKTSYGMNTPMHWGVKYEPVTVMIYEDLYQTKIGEFGCIRHQDYEFIGASPDGINILPTSVKYGYMLEIKNIVNREITGIPKEEYWIQTQIQMETCKLDKCDFVETRIKEYENEEDFYNNTSNSEYRGVVLHFIKSDFSENTEPIYHYMPLDIDLNIEAVNEWITQKKEELKSEGLVLFNTLYWYLDEISCVLIERNRHWFSEAIFKIKEVWDIIQEEKHSGYEHRSPKRKVTKTTVSVDDVSGAHTINNIPLSNRICLIKLDSK
jgi:putative phage-type endonuclease